MRIVYYPDPVLRKRAAPVAPDHAGLEDLVADMVGAMDEARGVGLAAPQVGLSIRLFLANPSGDAEDLLVCINPEVTPHGPTESAEEGCLSLPDLHAQVVRPTLVKMTWTGLDGVRHTDEFEGFLARILQHEYDHLEGVLFFERMTPADRIRIKADLASFEEQYREA
jgi:peptide deformylase